VTGAYFLAIGSAAIYGAADFFGGLATRRASTLAVVLLSQATGLVLLALLLPMLPAASPSRTDILWGLAIGVSGGVGVSLLYRALAIGSMAVVAPITAVCAVAIPVAVSVVLGERPAPLAVAGIALGIASIVLVSRQTAAPSPDDAGARRGFGPGVGTALASGIAVGLFFLFTAQTSPAAGMWPLLVARMVTVTLFGIIVVTRRVPVRMPGPVLALAIVAGAVDMFANALYLLAARLGPLSVVVTLSSLYPASTVLLARVVLGERLNAWQIVGVGAALTAIVLIVNG
jgi:drug/metabolite transporter (DMT)-like permease